MIVTLGDTITTSRCGQKKRVIRTVTWVGHREFEYRVWLSKEQKYKYFRVLNEMASLRFGDFIQRHGVQLKNLLKEKAQAKENAEREEKGKKIADDFAEAGGEF